MAPLETDAVIVGAGPIGLFQVFQLGLLDVHAHVIDALPHPGGQCAELYGDKPIYDIPATRMCTGKELTQQLLAQIAPFAPNFHFGQEVSSVQKLADGRFALSTTQGTHFIAKTIFIAAGVGAFVPRTLALAGIEQFAPTQLHYALQPASSYANKDVLILGETDAALEAALQLCAAHADGNPHKARSVTLVHRREIFKAAPHTIAAMQALCAAGAMRFIAGQATGFDAAQGVLSHLHITSPDAHTHHIAADYVVAFLGLSPKLGPIAHWGLDMERKQLAVDTEKFSTNVPGIFAVGDINTYPGKKKLIVCGFHEATLAAYGAIPIIDPERKVFLQYTTTSPKLHQLLGVS